MTALPHADPEKTRQGDRVRHTIFGDGTVEASKYNGHGGSVTIAFDDHGTKELMWSFAADRLFQLNAPRAATATPSVRIRTVYVWYCPLCRCTNEADMEPVTDEEIIRDVAEACGDGPGEEWKGTPKVTMGELLEAPDTVSCSDCGGEFDVDHESAA